MCFSQPVGQEHSKQQTRIVKRRLYTKIGLMARLLGYRGHIDYSCSIVQDSLYHIYILVEEVWINPQVTLSKFWINHHSKHTLERDSREISLSFLKLAWLAQYARRDSSAAQVGWSCSAPYQASQHQHSAELSCKLTAEWLLFITQNKGISVGDSWGAKCIVNLATMSQLGNSYLALCSDTCGPRHN